jgi:hypothetical protein
MMMPPTHVITTHVIALHVIALNGWRGRSEMPLRAWLAAGIRADQQHAIPKRDDNVMVLSSSRQRMLFGESVELNSSNSNSLC